MRAIGLPEHGAALQALDLPVPAPGRDEVLVRVLASSINPVDGYIAGGTYGTGELRYPVVPGRDFCGTVADAGAEVDGFRAGDRVLGCWTQQEFQFGAWAEYLTVPARSAIARCPTEMPTHLAAALPLAAATAQLALDELDPSAGETILIVGASGAVGCYAVQLAAARGARVIATAKPGEEQRLRSLGASETIDYTQLDVAATARELCPDGIPMLFDIVGDKPELLSLSELVADGGRVASARFAADRRVLAERGLKPINVLATGCGPEVIEPSLALAESGELEVLVTEVRSLEDLPWLVPEFARGGRGKIVVEVAS